MSNPLYAETILIGTSWQKIWPLASPIIPKKGMLLRVPANFGGAANTNTARFASSQTAANGIDIAFGDAGTITETTIFGEALQAVDSEVWAKGSAANTPLSIIVE